MAIPYLEVFLILLGVYLVYSVWARLDPRYPIAAALALLVVTAIVDAANAVATANLLAEYVFCLLGGGVVLLLVDHVRPGHTVPGPESDSGGSLGSKGPSAEPPDERDPSTEQLLDHVQEHLVPPVDAAREHDRPDEGERDGETQDGEGPGVERGVEEREGDAERDAGREERHGHVGAEGVDPVEDRELADR